MNRKTTLLAGFFVVLTPFVFGQEAHDQLASRSPEDVLASQQLIAWSWLQKPRPVPQPLPPPDKGVPQSDPQTPQPNAPQTQQQQTPTQTFTGKVVKNGDKYVLRAGESSYQLDDQNSAKQFEDKDVRIVGTIEAGSNTIHIVKIELVS